MTCPLIPVGTGIDSDGASAESPGSKDPGPGRALSSANTLGGMDLRDALDFIRGRREGVLTTLRRDGRAQLSNIIYAVGPDDDVRISVTATRAKTKNLQRDPRASLYVVGDNFWAYVVVDGHATLTPVAADPRDATVDELVELYRSMAGDHDNWDEYRAAMVADQRLVLRITPTSAYGMIGN